MNECDHLVGYGSDSMGGPLLASERDIAANASLMANQKWLEAGHGLPHYVTLALERDTPEKALAWDYDLFAYCPRCGARLTGVQVSQ